ncbi:DinB family protein [Pedobacter sp. PF22-3]|uniref:DinB family protein n=1 Tax=Pedobacter sp. PF22-3 TaxID=2994467 RepID=UPI00224700F0|nr:DinB family protein [Pedobacter sp. PF22-3]MCX2494199.1 DinB family protein [Pedobacter sp. PF22-3]
MTAAKIKVSIHRVVDAYKSKLSNYPDDVFQITPPISGWSYSEVYSHIFDSSLLSLIAFEHAANGKGESKPTHFMVKLILLLGTLPPAQKYKVPKRLEERIKKISKTEALEFILAFEKALDDNYQLLAHAKANSKTKHPRLGYLNAKQWLRFIEIHLKHHLKQLQRIEKSFQT